MFLGREKIYLKFFYIRDTRTPGLTRDVIDAYLEEMERQKDNPATTFTGLLTFCTQHIVTSYHESASRITNPLWVESTGH